MEEGLIYKIKNKNYEMIKEYKNLILFKDEHGIKECFTKIELYILFAKRGNSETNEKKV